MDLYKNSLKEESGFRETLFAWLALCRLPFHSVGVLPFLLGGVLAWQLTETFRWDIFVWGIAGVVFIMLSTYTAGEYWDVVEDSLVSQFNNGKSVTKFSGGSQVLQQGLLPRSAALRLSIVSLLLAGVVGLVLHFGYQTGPLTIPFGILGMIGGFFYSTKPIRWISRGWGELWIGLCYGWLTVATGYYLQAGTITPVVHWIAIPIGFTIFNVILLNEFPDYLADSEAGKRNLVVRLGPKRASYLYIVASLGAWVSMLFSPFFGVPIHVLIFYLPVLFISLILVVLMQKGAWHNHKMLEPLCGINIIVNLGTSIVYILSFIW
ncbi:MAG: prenyltransferase [Promethearchaeota archaeon]